MNTREKGEYAHLKVQQRALERGLTLSRPIMDARYDFIVDEGGKLERVQVKYGDGAPIAGSSNTITVSLRRWNSGRFRGRMGRMYSKEEVDALLVYVPKIDRVLRFEPEHFCEKAILVVRLAPSKNNQQKGVLLAEKFVW